MLFAFKLYSFDKSNYLISVAITPFPTIPAPENSMVEKGSASPLASKNIEVLSPLIGDKVKSGFVVKGNARTNDNIVIIRLYDSFGNIIIEESTKSNPPFSGNFGPFEKLISFNSTDISGTLEVFQYNDINGSVIDAVNIPLDFN